MPYLKIHLMRLIKQAGTSRISLQMWRQNHLRQHLRGERIEQLALRMVQGEMPKKELGSLGVRAIAM